VYAGSRAAGLVLALVATTALIGLRLAAAPTSSGYRHAMAAAPGGDLYEADAARGLVLATVAGRSLVRGGLPSGQPLALAADGRRLVLGTDRGLYQSGDGGAHWSAAAVAQGRYPAVWASGSLGLAGGWDGRLWSTRDAGATWEAFPTPPGDVEFQAVTVGDGVIYAATLQHVIRSFDAGRVWEVTALPARVTALEPEGQQLLAATWDGRFYRIDGQGAVTRLPDLSPGVWALAGGTAATTDGLVGMQGTPLDHREVTALISAGNALYAGIARGPVYGSPDGGRSWVRVLDG
jgi:photosystem II stability/assembly factor-like uncharacterized protein